jgi:hypothetical protein
VHISDVSNALKTQRLRQAETSGERNAYDISEALRNAVHVWTALCFCEHDAGGFDEKITNANTANDWPHICPRAGQDLGIALYREKFVTRPKPN